MFKTPWWRRWSPITITAGRWRLAIRLRIPWPDWHPLASIKLELAIREYRETHPRVVLYVSLWRLHGGIRLGGFWRDEDGDESSLAGAWLGFSTYGIPNLVCLLGGHKPDDYEYGSGAVFCERCHEQVGTREKSVAADTTEGTG